MSNDTPALSADDYKTTVSTVEVPADVSEAPPMSRIAMDQPFSKNDVALAVNAHADALDAIRADLALKGGASDHNTRMFSRLIRHIYTELNIPFPPEA